MISGATWMRSALMSLCAGAVLATITLRWLFAIFAADISDPPHGFGGISLVYCRPGRMLWMSRAFQYHFLRDERCMLRFVQ